MSKKKNRELLEAISSKTWTITRIKKPAAYEKEDEFDFAGVIKDIGLSSEHCELTACEHIKGRQNKLPKRNLNLIHGRERVRVKKNKIELYISFDDHHPHITRFVFKGNDKVGYRFTFKVVGVPGSHHTDESGIGDVVFVNHDDSGGGTGN